MPEPNGKNVANLRVGALTVVSWVVGIGTVAAIVTWGWLSADIADLQAKNLELERRLNQTREELIERTCP